MTQVENKRSDAASTPAPGVMRYMPQLDGLRTLAVIGVWFEHWKVGGLRGFRYIEWGRLGVWLFFVLSGFLITGILIKSKQEVDEGKETVGRAAGIFYIRRFLRILPVYYLTLFGAALIFPDVRRLFVWHLTYLTDVWVARNPAQYPPGVHFWTLAVEEQFYLLWPALVLLINRRRLVPTMLLMAAGSIAARGIFYGLHLSHGGALSMALPLVGNFDKFAFGGLLAAFRVQGGAAGETGARTLSRVGLFVGLPALLILQFLHVHHPDSWILLTFTSTAAGLFFAWLIAGASTGFRGPGGKFLSWRPLVALGKVSYGIYLFHMFVPHALHRAHVPLPKGVWPQFFVFAAVTCLLAAVSWFAFEAPINRLKRYFRYDAKPAKSAAMPVPAM